MWRNFGWTAILAIWTIFLIFNSGLAGERISNNPRINNADTFREVRREAAIPALDEQFVDDSRSRYAKEPPEPNHRSSTHMRAVSSKSKNTETRHFNGLEKSIAMSDAITAPPKCSRNCDDRNVRPAVAERVTTGNMWLSKIIILEKSGKTRYRKFPLNLRVSSPTFRGLKGVSRQRKHKEGTYVFSNGRKDATAIRRDAQAFDEEAEWRKGRIFSQGNRAAAFFHGKFSKRSQHEQDSLTTENSVILKLETPANSGSERASEIRETNNENRTNFHHFEPTRNSADDEPNYAGNNGDSRIVKATFSNHSSSKRDIRSATDAVTGDTIVRSSSHENSVASVSSTTPWTTLIFNSGLPNSRREVHSDENLFSRYHFPKDEYSRSYQVVAESRVAGTHEEHREEERSKVGFKVNTRAREDRKWNENVGDSLTFRAASSPDGYLNGNQIGFTERLPPPPRKKAANALRTALDTADSPREYHSSSLHNAGTITDGRAANPARGMQTRRTSDLSEGISGDVNYTITYNARNADERETLSANSAGDRIDESKVELPTSPRISVTQQWHPIHVRHVKSAGTACERRQTTDGKTEVHGTPRIGLRNVPRGLSGIVKSENPSEQKTRIRSRYLRKIDALDIGPSRAPSSRIVVIETAAADGAGFDRLVPATSIASGSISLDAAIISDNSTETWKINGRALSSSSSGESADKFDGKNAKVVMKNRDGNEDNARKEPAIRSRDDDARDLYRRYKRHQVRLSTRGSSKLTELETRRALDTITTATARTSLEFTASPSISTTQMSDADRVSVAAEESITTIGGSTRGIPTSPKYRGFQTQRRSITSMSTERYTSTPAKMDSDSLEMPINGPPKTLNASTVETPVLLIKTPDRLTAVTKTVNSVIRKEAATEAIAPASGENVLDVPSIEPISSSEGRVKFANGSAVPIIDPLPQKSSDPIRDIFGNVTAEIVDDSSAGTALLDQWPVKHSAVVEGDLVLGGLMMVHEREDTITCGPVMPQGGVQALEAMLYTLDTLNDREIVPGVKIGAHILDDCDKDTYGLEMAVDFIKEALCGLR